MRTVLCLLLISIGLLSHTTTLFSQTSCNDLKVVSTLGGIVNCIGVADLEVKGSEEQNTETLWYATSTEEKWFHKGSKFETPMLSKNTSYWVADALLKKTNFNGQGSIRPERSATMVTSDVRYGLLFEAYDNFVLKSVEVYPDKAGIIEISLLDSFGTVLAYQSYNIMSAVAPITVPLDFQIIKGEEYQLLHTSNPTLGLVRDSFISSFPYKLGVNGELGSITGGAYYNGNTTTKTNSYYYFYNWNIEHAEVICESTREVVHVNVTQDVDEIIEELPFSHSENTATYGNNIFGSPGDRCGVNENYLNGNEVIYKYIAVDNEWITIELMDLNKFYTGIFVYESCSDIGVSCVAGYAAGPTIDNVLIEGFEVEKGKTYYIVVSSWLTRAIDYTISIKSFDCSELELPLGDSIQYFADGETLNELKIKTTRPKATITWYEDPELTKEVKDPELMSLIDGSKYYVTQTFNDCESSALEITSKKITCSDLAITGYTDAIVECSGSMTLKASASGLGNQIYWYEGEIAKEIIGRGNSFETPDLVHDKSYWVSEAYTKEIDSIKGQAKKLSSTATFSAQPNIGLYFEAFQPFKILDVEVYSTGPSTSITIEIIDETDKVLNRHTAVIPAGTINSPSPHTIPLNFYVPKEGVYRLMVVDIGFSMLREVLTNADFPYPLATFGEITGGANGRLKYEWYPYFYNWTVGEENIVCESPRQEITAKIKQKEDIIINQSDLPYLDKSNTFLFGNNLSGNVGKNCIAGRYLDGYEVLYRYVGDLNNDNILQIQLSDVNNLDAAIFAYSSCGNIKVECLDGAIIQDGKAIIKDLFVGAGEDIIIVVSSLSDNTDYMLSVEGISCESLSPPSADTSPRFMQGETVSDLSINTTEFTQDITWYRDANLTDKIATPSTEVLISGNSYFVTQTILECESNALEVIPMEFEYNLAELEITNKINFLCMPGGMITLQVKSKGTGNDIYWYDSKTGGNIIGTGESINVFIEEDTSYWVSVVEKRDQGTTGNQLLDIYCKPNFNSPTACHDGDNINDFILRDSFGNKLISHLNTGCSTEGYGDFTNAKYLYATLYAGETYYFEVAHEMTFINQYVRIWIDYNGNGSFEDLGEFIYQASDASGFSMPSVGSFKVPEDVVSKNTIMRVKSTRHDRNNKDACTQSSVFGEVHDYKIGLIGKDVIYETPREEISVIINNSHSRKPNVKIDQNLCGHILLSEIKVLGPNIRWYDARGKEVSANTPVTKDEVYFVTQTIKGCESAMKEVKIEVMEVSNLPSASTNQAFDSGDTLEDLIVQGIELTWYKDQWKSKELPITTLLENQQTYYVTQVEEGKCESEPLGITVHEVLDVKDFLFNNFEFYPNPVDKILHITNSYDIDKIEVYDITGKIVHKQNNRGKVLEVDVSNFSTGTYLINILVENEIKSFRIVKR